MKTLYVLRHAKAVPDDGTIDDVDRRLAERGLNDMALMAAHLERARVQPDVVCCSPAVRTRQTLDAVVSALGSPQVVFDEVIYNASVDELIALARRLPPDADSAMFIGHNPGMGDFVGALTRSYVEMPTGALATLDVAVDEWSELKGANLRDVVVPKELRA